MVLNAFSTFTETENNILPGLVPGKGTQKVPSIPLSYMYTINKMSHTICITDIQPM